MTDGASILLALHETTTHMLEQRHDSDALIEGVETRQHLIDDYQHWAEAFPEEQAEFEASPDTKKRIEAILRMDQVIAKSLGEFKSEAQQNVKNIHAQQRMIGYLDRSASASGSYLDVKK